MKKITDVDLALIFKGLSHILYNQRKIMEHLNIENFYATDDTDELSVQFGKLAKTLWEGWNYDSKD